MIAKGCLEKWTYEAMLCYRIGCTCAGCSNNSLESTCKMKEVVLGLVKKFGAPQNIKRYYLGKGRGDDTEHTINTWVLQQERAMLQYTLQE